MAVYQACLLFCSLTSWCFSAHRYRSNSLSWCRCWRLIDARQVSYYKTSTVNTVMEPRTGGVRKDKLIAVLQNSCILEGDQIQFSCNKIKMHKLLKSFLLLRNFYPKSAHLVSEMYIPLFRKKTKSVITSYFKVRLWNIFKCWRFYWKLYVMNSNEVISKALVTNDSCLSVTSCALVIFLFV